MLAALLLHIAALSFWTASLIYLPALIAGERDVSAASTADAESPVVLARLLFTRIATPAALFAIVAGTVVLVLNRTVDPWLVVKLTLVTGLVILHCATGFLIVQSEAAKARPIILCRLAMALAALLTAGIVWIVLGKPEFEGLL